MLFNHNLSEKQTFIQREIGLNGFSFSIKIEPVQNAIPKQCFENVSGLVESYKGRVKAQVCWIIYNFDELQRMAIFQKHHPEVVSSGFRAYPPVEGEILAELHCIILDTKTKTYHDITPDKYGLTSRTIVFEPRITLKELQAYQRGRYDKTGVQQGINNISNKQPHLWKKSIGVSNIWDLL